MIEWVNGLRQQTSNDSELLKRSESFIIRWIRLIDQVNSLK
ncbi:hypothetical protein [Paenibacillus andongensis]|nr:hypothetical protein [Paenibacillus andongensis]